MLVLCKISRLFVKTLTADDIYSLLSRDNLTQPTQILSSRKEKNLFGIFFAFFKSILNFKHFQKKDDPHSRCIC